MQAASGDGGGGVDLGVSGIVFNDWGQLVALLWGSRGLERHGQLIGQSIEGGSFEVVAGKCISSDV